MGILDNLGDFLKQVSSGNAPEAEVHAAYDQVAQSVPQGTLAEGLAHAFNSKETPPFEQMVSGLYGQSSPDQKAGLINQILGALGPGGVSQVLAGAGGLSGLAGLLSGGSVTSQQAEQIPPDAVQTLAQHAAKQQPSIVDSAAAFYAQHSTLVKAIGAGALAILMRKISQSRS
ncbi:MAG TPA: hypothetical protein DCP92_13170 [Nitrospiraceae bacterium]|jgi:hypothetical protein|nr:hypothetical protein [Nitrospiraceae bacterium]